MFGYNSSYCVVRICSLLAVLANIHQQHGVNCAGAAVSIAFFDAVRAANGSALCAVNNSASPAVTTAAASRLQCSFQCQQLANGGSCLSFNYIDTTSSGPAICQTFSRLPCSFVVTPNCSNYQVVHLSLSSHTQQDTLNNSNVLPRSRWCRAPMIARQA